MPEAIGVPVALAAYVPARRESRIDPVVAVKTNRPALLETPKQFLRGGSMTVCISTRGGLVNAVAWQAVQAPNEFF